MIRVENMFKFNQMVVACRGLLIHSRLPPVYVQQVAGSKSLVDTLNERLGLPPRPKKPLTPYFRYLKETRPTVLKNNPTMGLSDVVKAVAKKWETIDASSKEKLSEEYKAEQAEYLKKRALYDSKLTVEQKAQLQHLKDEVVQSRKERILKREKDTKSRELNKPRRPISAFLAFLNLERVKTPQDSLSYRDWQQKIAAKWTAMSDAEKAPLQRKAKEQHDQYKVALQKWEDQMLKLGHSDVIRTGSLIQPDNPDKPKRTRKPKSIQ